MARPLHIQRYLIAGLLTFVPIWLTWVLFSWVFSLLSGVNLPWVSAVFEAFPNTLGRLRMDWLISLIAFVATVILLYVLGLAATHVIGQRVLAGFEAMILRIPGVNSIYGGTKKMMGMLQNKPSGTQRVVLIDFPAPPLKAVGFVTTVFRDAHGVECAAVYVPTTPNPTGGYLELVPVEHLIATDWTMDQAMAFILSAGAATPEHWPAIRPTGGALS